MKNVALIVIYNHQYNDNIDIIESIYKNRFSNIYHLMPFYIGNRKNVISVYENSYYFQGFVSQSAKILKGLNFTHYFYIADDMLLNPMINEGNYVEFFKLKDDDNFFPGFISLHNSEVWWERALEAYNWKSNPNGIEINNLLPNYNDVLKMFEKHKLDVRPLKFQQIWRLSLPNKLGISVLYNTIKLYSRYIISLILGKTYTLKYPLVGGYSDIFIISSQDLDIFALYCGIFSSTHLFVELAIPTSLVISTDKIVTEEKLPHKGKLIWKQSQFNELEQYKYSLNALLKHFPSECLYIHPIKLSKWNL